MKRRLIACLVATAVLSAAAPAGVAAQGEPKVEEVKARAAKAQAEGKTVVVKLREGAKVFVGGKEVPYHFKRGESFDGRIREARDKDFTLVESDGRTEIATVISYDDVLSVEHPPRFKRALKVVGRTSLGVTLLPVLLPLYGILALTGQLPSC
ncbi:MAG: hypothetical protein ACJ741_04485 [Pyrinomonadaceae bacterium]